MRAHTLGLKFNTHANKPWTKADEQIVLEFYERRREVCWARLPNRSIAAIERKGAELGLSRDQAAPFAWTPDELTVLHEHFPLGGVNGVHQRLPQRTREEIGSKADQQGIAWLAAPWTLEEDQVLLATFHTGSDACEQALPHRTAVLIAIRCKELNLRRSSGNYLKSSWMQPAKLAVKSRPAAFTPEEDALIREHYPRGGVESCRPYLQGRAGDSIQRRAHALKVRFRAKPDWTWKPEEDEVLRVHYAQGGLRACYQHLSKRSRQAINTRAGVLGIHRAVPASFSPAQIEQLERIASYQSQQSIPELAIQWDVPETSLSRRVQRMRVANAPMLEIPEGERYMTSPKRAIA